MHAEFRRSERGDKTENEAAIALKYGLTGDWVAGLELPYQYVKESGERNDEGQDRCIPDLTVPTVGFCGLYGGQSR